MNFAPAPSIHELLSNTIQRAFEKTAADSDTEEKVNNLLRFEKKEHGHIPTIAEEKAEYSKSDKDKKDKKSGEKGEMTSSERIEKLASAVEFIVDNADHIVQRQAGIIESALAKLAGKEVPPAVHTGGGSVVRAEASIDGQQTYKKDQVNGETAEGERHSTMSGARPLDGKALLQNNLHAAPGGGGMAPKSKYPEKGPLTNIKTAGAEYGDAERNEQIRTARGYGRAGAVGGALSGVPVGALAGVLHAASNSGNRARMIAEGVGGAVLGSAALGGLGYGVSRGGTRVLNRVARAIGGIGEKPEGAETPAHQAAEHEKQAGFAQFFANNPRLASALATGGVAAIPGAVGGFMGGGHPDAQGQTHRLSGALKGGLTTGAIGAAGGALGAHAAGYHEAMPVGLGQALGIAKSASEQARSYILNKLAGQDVMEAQISAPKDASALAGGGVLETMDASKVGPAYPGGPNGAGGNGQRSLIASNASAINFKKRDAKRPQIDMVEGVLVDSKLNQSTDSKLQENLRSVGQAGVKIAADGRSLLQKIASGQGTPEQTAYLRRLVKQAEAEAPVPGMTAMAGSDTTPDGCTCGKTGECRVCKLRAALEAAKGQGSAQPSAGQF